MFRFFEGLVDPYAAYTETDTPPTRLWPWLKDYIRPFRKVFAVTGTLSVASAFIEVALIWYLGRLIDLMVASGPAAFFAQHGVEVALVALAVLLVRPMIQVGSVALLHNTILPNFGTMIRWRAHRHVIRQPVGWFESDFAGRIANRIMQTPPAAGDAVFQTFDAVAFAAVTIVGAGLMLADRMAGLEDRSANTERELARLKSNPPRVEVPVVPRELLEAMAELAARAEAVAMRAEEALGEE